jgi:hypothetical protein
VAVPCSKENNFSKKMEVTDTLRGELDGLNLFGNISDWDGKVFVTKAYANKMNGSLVERL